MSYQENTEQDEAYISYQEKSIIVSIITNLVCYALYGVVVWQRYQAGSSTMMDETFKFWASVILILIPVLVGAQLISQIVFVILNTIITREEQPDITDELDKLIELKSTRNFYHIFMVGFVVAMGSQVINLSPTVMFVILFGAIMLAGVMGDVFRLYFYRKGL